MLARTLIVLLLLAFTLPVEAQTRVRGYYKSNGTYVQPYVRSSRDSIKYNNYSTKGNYNPYSGNKGYKDPYAPKKYYGGYRY